MLPEQAEVTRWLVKAQHDWAVAQKALQPLTVYAVARPRGSCPERRGPRMDLRGAAAATGGCPAGRSPECRVTTQRNVMKRGNAEHGKDTL